MDVTALMSCVNLEDKRKNVNNYAAKVGGVHTEFVIAPFSNQDFIMVTQSGRAGTFFSVTVDQPENTITPAEIVYSVRPLFGPEIIEVQAAARFLAEKLDIKKPLLISLNLKDYNRTTIVSVSEALKYFYNK